MKFRFSILALSLTSALAVSAQSVTEIRNSSDYIYGEGFGRTLRAADNDALQNLISKISVSVESDFSSIEEEVNSADGLDATQAVKSVINTYSQATLQNTERLVIKQEPDAEVFRFVKRSEVDRIFEARRTKLLDMIQSAAKAEKSGKIDDALRYYYWGFCLLQSLPSSNAVTDSEGHILVNYIPEQINTILDDIRFVCQEVKGNDVDLSVLYKGQPVTSLDYTYFDGMNWSNLYSARDGRGVLEMRPGAVTDNMQVKCEYEFAGESHIDKEIAQVVEVMKGRYFRSATKIVDKNGKNAEKAFAPSSESGRETASLALSENQPVRNTLTLLSEDESAPYRESIGKLLDCISNKAYSQAESLFTPDGYSMFESLISYGSARILGQPDPVYMSMGDEVVCRYIPMNFSFKNNDRQFVENITFTFNADRKIDCLAFGLDEQAADDILHHAAWGEYARKILTEFLENYKTAYSLKRLDYLRSVFDDNAVIITGKVVTRPQLTDVGSQYSSNRYVQLTRQSKEQYLRNLERCFDSNEFINIRFAENDVVKAGVGGEVYGIQIKQDYYSSNYGDTGYLFLMVDLNDPKQPIIKVRVWQPEKDPDFKGLPNF